MVSGTAALSQGVRALGMQGRPHSKFEMEPCDGCRQGYAVLNVDQIQQFHTKPLIARGMLMAAGRLFDAGVHVFTVVMPLWS